MVVHPARGRQVDHCEFKASLVYTDSSRPTKSLSQKKKKKKKKRKSETNGSLDNASLFLFKIVLDLFILFYVSE